ncbi:MAG: hypothetical protein Q7J85_11745, partial [Bacillota bacterium]|nr:hypothetical protein [Bacillota bacterium]
VVLQLLQFYKLTEQAESLSRKVCINIRDDRSLIPGGEIYFEDTIFLGTIERVYYRLQQGDRPTLDEVNGELQEFGFDLDQDTFDDLLFQLAAGDERQKVENLLQTKTASGDRILKLLNWQFCKYLLECRGLNFIIGGTLFFWLKNTFNIRDSEDNGDVGENGTKELGLPSDCFVFQQDKFERQLKSLGSFLSNQWPQVAGLLWGAPYFYEFLYEYGAVTEENLEHVRDKLTGLQQQFMENYSDGLWHYSFVHGWPPPAGMSEEAWAAEKERFDRSFTEVPDRVKKRETAFAPQSGLEKALTRLTSPKKPLTEAEKLKEAEQQAAAEKKRRKKQKARRKETKKQKRKQRK